MNWFERVNRKYDSIKEPYRFLLFIVFINIPLAGAIAGVFHPIANGIIVGIIGLITVGRSYLMMK